MKILGISAFYHDAAAAVIKDGEIIAAAQEERFTRKKHDASFPVNAVKFCLEYSGTTIGELDAFAFYDKPFLKFERLLETYYGFSPAGLKSFWAAIPVWLREKVFLKKLIKDELSKMEILNSAKTKILFPEHHLSHAASAFYPSPFSEAAIITIDGVGEWATASICHGKGKEINILKELRFPHSLGLLYSAFTYYLGFKVNSGEYKLMGLAPYGDASSQQVVDFVNIIKNHFIDIRPDGSVWLNQKKFNYATGLRMVNRKEWERHFGFPPRAPEEELEQCHCNLGLAIQKVTEEIVMGMADEAKRQTGSKNVCLAGGVALNCVANGKLLRSKIFDNVFIQPAAGDAGGSVGAALAAYHIYFKKERLITEKINSGNAGQADNKMDEMKGAYLGPEFSDTEIKKAILKYKPVFTGFTDFGLLAEQTAIHISNGSAVGWLQGRMEFGPRALGNRSILGDARNPDMQKKMNLKIKYRESFRPFAPSVLAEDAAQYFEMDGVSPYMLLVYDVLNQRRKELPPGYARLQVRDKLYHQRSDIPAVTHIDFSARIQTVHKKTNERFWKLINAFKNLTGYGLLVNTSFNVRGEPIVCTPEDAYRCFMRTEMDYLVMGNLMFDKKLQPEWKETKKWKEEFVLD